MCGINGIVSFGPPVEHLVIQKMNDALTHRGPDHSAIWFSSDRNIALGNTRLSIIDLNERGNQPMCTSDGRYVIVYNGEIYNYRELRNVLTTKGYSFRSFTDTEVALISFQEWGENCVNYFDGMFAFAIWDNHLQQLFLGRDRIGEKPLFYYQDNTRFVFASEMKALWKAGVPKEINNNLLRSYLISGTTFNPFDLAETFYNGVSKLKAAHTLTLRLDSAQPSLKRYWMLQEKETRKISFEDSVHTYKSMLQESVHKRLHASAEAGACLSGGLDSTAIVCLSRSLGYNPKTYSARFTDLAYDEGDYIAEMTQHHEDRHTDILVTEENLIDSLEKMFYHQETPYHGASFLSEFLVMQQVHAGGTKVILDGEGSDEILGGYEAYYETILRHVLMSNPFEYLTQLKVLRSNTNHRGIYTAKFFIASLLPSIYRGVKTAYKNRFSNKFFTKEFIASSAEIRNPDYIYSNLEEHMNRNCVGGDLEYMLGCCDRSSMASSVEARMPFLQHRIIEFLNELPMDFKIHDFQTKYLHRKAMEGVIPDKILNRKDKNGYAAPQESLMKNPRLLNILGAAKSKLAKAGIINDTICDFRSDLNWRIIMANQLTG